MGKVKLTIGDWSEDGHNVYEELVYETTKSIPEIRQAYKDSCKLTGVQFNGIENNYAGLASNSYNDPLSICAEYEDFTISPQARKILEEHGLSVKKGGYYSDPDGLAELILNFIKLSLPDFTWEEASVKRSEVVPPINGWWNDELNCAFGYGIYD